jgi:hypothetical protein
MEFSRAGNYGISGPRKFWFAKPEFPAPLQNVAPHRFVKDVAEFRREFPAPEILSRGGISGPESKFPAF